MIGAKFINNMNSKPTQNKTRNLLYALLAIPVLINLYLTYNSSTLTYNRYVVYAIELAITIIVLFVAKMKDILNWKSLAFTCLIAGVCILFALFR